MPTQAQRDEDLTNQQSAGRGCRLDITSEDPDYGIRKLALFGPQEVLEVAMAIYTRYTAGEIHAKLTDSAELLPNVRVIELRNMDTRRTFRFRMLLSHRLHGQWSLEIPPVTSASLERRQDL